MPGWTLSEWVIFGKMSVKSGLRRYQAGQWLHYRHRMGSTWDDWMWSRDDTTDAVLRREIESLGELMIAAAAQADIAAKQQAQLNVGLAVNRLADMRPWTS